MIFLINIIQNNILPIKDDTHFLAIIYNRGNNKQSSQSNKQTNQKYIDIYIYLYIYLIYLDIFIIYIYFANRVDDPMKIHSNIIRDPSSNIQISKHQQFKLCDY